MYESVGTFIKDFLGVLIQNQNKSQKTDQTKNKACREVSTCTTPEKVYKPVCAYLHIYVSLRTYCIYVKHKNCSTQLQQ